MPEPEPRDPYRPLLWPELIHRLRPFAAEVSQPVYIVGGAVRDALAGRPVHDVDLAVAQGGIRLARRIANGLDGGFFVLDRERDVRAPCSITKTAKYSLMWPVFVAPVCWLTWPIAISLSKPWPSSSARTARRSSIRWAVRRTRALKCCASAARPPCITTPARPWRALRLAAPFELRIEPATRLSIHAVHERLYDSSAERVRDEFWRLLALPRVGAALRVASATGLLVRIVPETGDLSARPARNDAYSDAWQEHCTLTSLRQIVRLSGPQADQHGATFGVGMLVMQLDRWRPQLQQHLQHSWPNGRRTAPCSCWRPCSAQWARRPSAELRVKRARCNVSGKCRM